MAVNFKGLVWDPGAYMRYQEAFKKRQKYIDSEVLRLCDPLIPLKTGTLKRSGQTHTEIGSGLVQYSTPYAARQYYSTSESRSYDPRRGAHWFDRMKAAHKNEILEGARKIE